MVMLEFNCWSELINTYIGGRPSGCIQAYRGVSLGYLWELRLLNHYYVYILFQRPQCE